MLWLFTCNIIQQITDYNYLSEYNYVCNTRKHKIIMMLHGFKTTHGIIQQCGYEA